MERKSRSKRGTRSGARLKAATTAEVVGAGSEKAKVPRKWRLHYKRLMDLRGQSNHRRDSLVREARDEQPAFSLHMGDAGTDHYDRDFALSMVSSEQNALYEIEEALNRIRNGNYGICEVTGRPIEKKRLEAVPWTRFSAEAEKQLEKEGAIVRSHLGPREEVPRTSVREGGEETGES